MAKPAALTLRGDRRRRQVELRPLGGGEGIPVIKSFFVEDIRKVPLEPWDRKGGNGCVPANGRRRAGEQLLHL